MIVGIAQQMIGVGFIVSTWVGYGSSKVPETNSFSWRFPLAFQCVPCLLIICGIMFFPEVSSAETLGGKFTDVAPVSKIPLRNRSQ